MIFSSSSRPLALRPLSLAVKNRMRSATPAMETMQRKRSGQRIAMTIAEYPP